MDQIEDYKQLKDNIISLRESGKLEDALSEFKKLKEKMENEGAYRDLVDVLGHMRITYGLMADNIPESNPNYKDLVLENLLNAESSMNKARFIMEMHKDEVPLGTKAIFLVHGASTKLSLVKFLKSEEEVKIKLLSALQDINDALEVFPGTIAHKAWPASLKAKILMELGETEDAIETVEEGYLWIKQGYDQESQNSDGPMKLAIWETGLKITEARILKLVGKVDESIDILKTVVEHVAPENNPGCLENHRAEARKLIEQFVNSSVAE